MYAQQMILSFAVYSFAKSCYTVKFDIPDQSVPLVKFFKNPLYQEIRYIENKFIIDYNNPFQTSIPLYRGFTYGPVYQRSGILNFTVYKVNSFSVHSKKNSFA